MTSTASARITGPELLALWEQMKNGPKSEMVRAAGYVGTRDDGSERLCFTDFYEAVIAARNGYGNPGPTSAILAGWTTPEGEPIGPWFPIVPGFNASGSARISFTEDALAAAKQWVQDHAVRILDPHPVAYLVICDDVGTERLMKAERMTWVGSFYDTTSYLIGPCDSLPHDIHCCEQCGAFTTEGEGTETASGFVCSDCAESLADCDRCGATVESDSLTTVADESQVCPHCLRRHYNYCPRSEQHHPIDEMVRIYGSWWEDGTAYSFLHRDEARDLLNDGRLWLDSDGDYTSDQPEPDDDDEEEDQGPEDGTMRRYGYHTEANSTLGRQIPSIRATYGAELEYKGSPDDWEAVAEACQGKAILTDDSTVSGELVSAAMGAGEMRAYLQEVSAALAGSRNDEATGLHFHVGRQALTAWEWFRLTQYTKRHAEILHRIAGRDSQRWGSFTETSADTWERFVTLWHDSSGDRYDGWSFRPHTVELRVCRATKTPFRILARFAMLQRLIAIGRLPDSAKPSGPELMGWLAQDPNIQRLTGWEVGSFNYREALQLPAQGPDLSPSQSATRADVWLAEVRLKAAERFANYLYQRLVMPWEGRQDTTDRINRMLFEDEQRRIADARRTLLLLTT